MEGTIASVMMFAGNFAPRTWAFCHGQLMSIAQNTALFSIVGTLYGGDGRTTFALPDLRGRTPIGHGQGPGLSDRRIGQMSGEETVTLTQLEMPAHSHSASPIKVNIGANNQAGDSDDPSGRHLAKANIAARGVSDVIGNIYSGGANTTIAAPDVTGNVGNAGGSQGHQNMQPYLAIPYIICMSGIFPSRN